MKAKNFVPLSAALIFTCFAAQAAPADVALPGDHAFPESLSSSADGTLYIGGLTTGGVLRIKAGSANAEQWIKPGAFGTRSIFGVLVDEHTKTLWTCSNDISAAGILGPGDVTGSYIKGFNLATGEGKVSAKLPGAKALCNDIAIGPDGAPYVTNSFAPEILRFDATKQQLDVWVSDPLLAPPEGGAGLDGLAFDRDGNLVVDTYNKAELFRIDAKDGKAGKVAKLTPSRALVLADGIRQDGNGFLIVEGGGRLDRMSIEGDKATIATLKDGMVNPTAVTTVGSTAWVADGQVGFAFAPKSGQPHLPFTLYAVALPAP